MERLNWAVEPVGQFRHFHKTPQPERPFVLCLRLSNQDIQLRVRDPSEGEGTLGRPHQMERGQYLPRPEEVGGTGNDQIQLDSGRERAAAQILQPP